MLSGRRWQYLVTFSGTNKVSLGSGDTLVLTRRVWTHLILLSVSVSAIAVGFSLGWPTPVIPKFHNNETGFNVTEDAISWAVAIASPGFMTGSLISRYISDRSGRKATILTSALPFIIGTVVILNSTRAWMFCLARFLWGVGSGLVRTVAGMYIAEISDKEIRGTLLSIDRVMFNFGIFACMAVGAITTYQTLNCMLLVVPVCYFIICFFIPESPYFLIKEGKVNDARKVLQTFSDSNDENVIEEKLTSMRADVQKEMLRSGSVNQLFTKHYRKLMIIVLGVKLTHIAVGSIVMQNYAGRIVQESKTNISLTTVLVVFGAVKFIIGILTVVIVDRIGRRPLLLYSYLLSGIVMTIMAIYFYIDPPILTYYTLIPFFGLVIISILSTAGYGAVAYIIISEIFPINIKAVGIAFVNIYGGSLNFLFTKGYQQIKDISGLTGVFLFYAIFGFIGAVFTYFIVPETKGKSLREIQIQLHGNIYDDPNLDQELEVFENKNKPSSPLNNVVNN